MRYIRCRTCGKYTEAASAFGHVYCSEACAAGFERCTNCGRYFRAGGGFRDETCSQDCSIQYNIHRFGGALPAKTMDEEAP